MKEIEITCKICGEKFPFQKEELPTAMGNPIIPKPQPKIYVLDCPKGHSARYEITA